MRDPEYLAFLRADCRCAVGLRCVTFARVGGCEAAHGPVNGMRSKGPDNEALPLCPSHHREQHAIGLAAFEVKYGFNWKMEAAAHYKTYLIWKEAQA